MEISKEKCCLITENAKNDNIMSTDELSNLLGVDFYEVFKPSSVFNERLEKALSLAKKSDFSGFDYISYFDKNGFARVELNGRYNLIDKKGNLLSQQWFNYVSYFENGLARVKLNHKFNLICTNGNLLSKQWFDDIYNFDKNGLAQVMLNDKWNFIDTNGNLNSKQWFDRPYSFDENGFALVELNKKYNFINIYGNLITKEWFGSYWDAGHFEEEFLN